MVILGVDTATPATAAAVLRADGSVVERRHDPAPGERPGHGPQLLQLVAEALEGTGWDAVRRIAVGVGPGGFTGLRIGIATARGLAQARGVEIVGVSSLAALAAAAADAGRAPCAAPGAAVAPRPVVLAVIDARRREAFAAAYGPDGTELAAPAALGADALGALAAAHPGALAVGDGAVAFRAALEAAGAQVPPDGDPAHRVPAASVCRLGAAAQPGEPPLPDYRREPDAQPRRAP